MQLAYGISSNISKLQGNRYCTNVEFALIQDDNHASIVSYSLAILGKVMETNIKNSTVGWFSVLIHIKY